MTEKFDPTGLPDIDELREEATDHCMAGLEEQDERRLVEEEGELLNAKTLRREVETYCPRGILETFGVNLESDGVFPTELCQGDKTSGRG